MGVGGWGLTQWGWGAAAPLVGAGGWGLYTVGVGGWSPRHRGRWVTRDRQADTMGSGGTWLGCGLRLWARRGRMWALRQGGLRAALTCLLGLAAARGEGWQDPPVSGQRAGGGPGPMIAAPLSGRLARAAETARCGPPATA